MRELTEFQSKIRTLLPETDLRFCEPMDAHTSFRIGGPAEVMAFPKNIEELSALLNANESNEGQVYICHLRRKLEHAFGLRLIRTVRNWGYRYEGQL
jgi:UDP-N-acetylenolpyruvoylglucosamine reductase